MNLDNVPTFLAKTMSDRFPLVPRYGLDDEKAWLVGIDPLRRYWLLVNGDESTPVILPGLNTDDFEAFQEAILTFRSMVAGDTLKLPTVLETQLVIKCVSKNCFVIDTDVNGYPATHIFDQESLESLLMTAHPDWRWAPHQGELSYQVRSLSWDEVAAVQAA